MSFQVKCLIVKQNLHLQFFLQYILDNSKNPDLFSFPKKICSFHLDFVQNRSNPTHPDFFWTLFGKSKLLELLELEEKESMILSWCFFMKLKLKMSFTYMVLHSVR